MSSNNANRGNVQDGDKTWAINHNLQLYYPIKLSEKAVVLTGFTVEHTNLNMFDSGINRNLFMTRLNLGAKFTYNDRWAVAWLVLPKIASNFSQVGLRDLQIGGLGIAYYKISDHVTFNFGLYASTENHGSTVAPLLGLFYRTPNRKLYINAVLPIRADINYTIVNNFSVGIDFLTSTKSYDLSDEVINAYAHENSIRMGAYLAYGFMDGAFILRLRGGYDLTRYGLYDSGDPVGAQVLLWSVSGDNRNMLNSRFVPDPYIGGDLIYRFDLTKQDDEKKVD